MCGFLVCSFFFFKQKTAYEMRISDWSSDVCSSDLVEGLDHPEHRGIVFRRRRLHCRDPLVEPGIVDFEQLFVVVDLAVVEIGEMPAIGRASCRERVCQYV